MISKVSKDRYQCQYENLQVQSVVPFAPDHHQRAPFVTFYSFLLPADPCLSDHTLLPTFLLLNLKERCFRVNERLLCKCFVIDCPHVRFTFRLAYPACISHCIDTSTMKLPLRIGVLECDTPLAQTREKYGGYGGVFTALLKAGADALRSKGLSSKEGLDITCWDVVNEKRYPALEDLDAILISGSRESIFLFCLARCDDWECCVSGVLGVHFVVRQAHRPCACHTTSYITKLSIHSLLSCSMRDKGFHD